MQKLRKLDRALINGEWYDAAKSTKTFGGIAIGIGLVAGAGAAIYGASTQSNIANQQLSLEQTQAGRQGIAFNQLQQLIQNPGSFFSSPVYQAAFGQGTNAVLRGEAAGGYAGSSNMATALQSYGQSFGQQQLLSQEELLAGMSGTTANPAAAGSAASGAASAATGSMNSLAGMLAFFGAGGLSGGGGGGGASQYFGSSGLGYGT